eukprot:m.12023 g.12023  ORF g.12023 m.12023 type:complete len:457 (-) comp5797_c0_seq2:297-1667(-)
MQQKHLTSQEHTHTHTINAKMEQREGDAASAPEERVAQATVQLDEADPLADGGMIADDDVEQVIELDGTMAPECVEESEDEDDEDEGEDDMDAADDADGEGEGARGDGEEPLHSNAIGSCDGHDEPVFCVAMSPAQDVIATGSQDDTAVLARLDSGEVAFKFEGHKDSVTAVAFSASGEFLATGSLDGMIRVWNTSTHEVVLELDSGDDLMFMEWHPKANFLVAGSASGSVLMWDVPAGNMSYFSGHGDTVSDGHWLPGGRAFVTGSDDGTLIMWSPKTKQPIMKLDAKVHMFHTCPVTAVACSPDNVMFATGGADNAVKLINSKASKVVCTFEGHTDVIETLAFSNTQPIFLASGSLDGTVKVYNVATQAIICSCAHEDAIVKVKWHPSKPILYSCSTDGTSRVWDGRTGEPIYTCIGHTHHVLDFAMNTEGNQLVSVGEDGQTLVFAIDNLPAA